MVSASSSMCLDQWSSAGRPLATKRRVKNACAALGCRTSGLTSNDFGKLHGGNLRILRNIILQKNSSVSGIEESDGSGVEAVAESGRAGPDVRYFLPDGRRENRLCKGCGNEIIELWRRIIWLGLNDLIPTPYLTAEPQLLYELPRRSKAEKIEDSLLCQCPLEKVLSQASEQKPILLALTANNWLYCLSADTGETLQKVYLSSHFKFRSLDWDISQETFYVKSVHRKQTPVARQAGTDNVLMHLAIFTVFPLQVVGLLEISKKVFGKSVVDVLLSQGVLAVSHSSKCVKLYSLEHIVKKFRTTELVLGQQCDLYGARGIVGEVPYGIPVNIQIKECPPVLFEMSYLDNGIQIGGHPWHYIYTPNHKKHKGTHHICSIRDGTLAKNGVQDMKCDSLEADWIFFHPDDSGRIIHAGPSTINVLKIKEEKDFDSHYEVIHDFSIVTSRDRSATSQVTVTSSGRTVKRRFQQLDDDPEQETFKMAKYEDELDLLAIVDVSPTEEDVGQASVQLYDNKSGGLMKRITLKEPWDVTYSHEVYLDRDTVIHIEQERNNSFCCHVYKMNRKSC